MDAVPQWVLETLANGDVPIKLEHRRGTQDSSGSGSAAPAARNAPEPKAGAVVDGKHYDSREAAAARATLPTVARELKLTLKTEDETIFTGERTMTATVTKSRELCRAVEKELGDAARGMPVTLLVDGAVLCEKNGGLGMLETGDATLWVKLQTGSNRAKRQRAEPTGANDTPLGNPGDADADGARMSKRQQKLERRKQQVEASKEKKHQLCIGIATKNQCTYGTGCKFSHDVPAYLKLKPADIGDTCPFFSKYGRCPYGVLCRFGSEHITESGTIIRDDAMPLPHEAAAAAAAAAPVGEAAPAGGAREESLSDKMMLTVRSSNHMPKVVQASLRKNKYIFRSADEVARMARKDTAAARANLDGVSRRKFGQDKQPDGSDKPTAAAASTDATAPVVAPQEAPAVVPAEASTENPAAEKPAAETPAAAGSESSASRTQEKKQTSRESAASVAKFQRDLEGKLYLAPLTTVGNLPFRRLCVGYGADITCGEMAMAKNLLAGQSSEWALLRKHESEAASGQMFGVQICGAHVDMMAKVSELIEDHISLDFVDINMGCPIDIVCNKGMGCGMAERPARMEEVVVSIPLPLPLLLLLTANDRLSSLAAFSPVTLLTDLL